jgi:hypothetical protein
VVRFQHLHPICIGREANVGNRRTTSKLMILVEFLNLTFDFEADITRVSNVEFIPLGDLGANPAPAYSARISTRVATDEG